MPQYNDVFEKISLSTFPKVPSGSVAVIRTDMTLREAVEFLHARKILSAPVVDATLEAQGASWKEKYIGILDVGKLAAVTLQSLEHKTVIREEAEDEDSAQSVLSPLPTEFASGLVGSLAKKENGLYPFLPLDVNSTLLDAVVLLGSCRVKRLPLIDEAAGDIVNIVSQSSVVHLLAQHLAEFGAVAEKTLDELGLAAPRLVYSIRAEQPIHAAFTLIDKHGLSAVPVVGEDGAIIGNISARHVFYIITAPNKLRLLEMPATAFLRLAQDMVELGGEASANISNTAITCRGADTLGSTIARMDAAHIHRIYVCDASNRPVRVLSLCDVLEAFAAAPDGNDCKLQ